MDHFVDDRTLEDNVDSFFSHDVADLRDRFGQSADINKGTDNANPSLVVAHCLVQTFKDVDDSDC